MRFLIVVCALSITGCATETSWTRTTNQFIRSVNQVPIDQPSVELIEEARQSNVFIVAIRYPTDIDSMFFEASPYQKLIEGAAVDANEIAAKSVYYAMELYLYLTSILPEGSVALWPVQYEYLNSRSGGRLESEFGDVVSLFTIDVLSYSDYFNNKLINSRECYIGTCFGQQFMFELAIHSPRRILGISCTLRFREREAPSTAVLDPSPVGATILDAAGMTTCLEENYEMYISSLADQSVQSDAWLGNHRYRQMEWEWNEGLRLFELPQQPFFPFPRAQIMPPNGVISGVRPLDLRFSENRLPTWNGLLQYIGNVMVIASKGVDFEFEISPKLQQVAAAYGGPERETMAALLEAEFQYVGAYTQALFEHFYYGEYGEGLREYLASEKELNEAGTSSVINLLATAGLAGAQWQGSTGGGWPDMTQVATAMDITQSIQQSTMDHRRLNEAMTELRLALGLELNEEAMSRVTNQRTFRNELRAAIQGNEK